MAERPRRAFLRLAGVSTVGLVAGCSGSDPEESGSTVAAERSTTSTADRNRTGDEKTQANGGATTVMDDGTAAEPNSRDGRRDPRRGSGPPPGRDQFGGPDALQSAGVVEAFSLREDQGGGRAVFSAAIVWVSAGTTITWEVASGNHSVTAYHPDNGTPLRIPEAAVAFDSGVMSAGDLYADGNTFTHTFEVPGVYNYFSEFSAEVGMVGIVVVDGPRGGPGTTAPTDVEHPAARDSLERLLAIGGIPESTE